MESEKNKTATNYSLGTALNFFPEHVISNFFRVLFQYFGLGQNMYSGQKEVF